ESINNLTVLSLLNISDRLLPSAVVTRAPIDVADHLPPRLLDHSFHVARNASVFDRNVDLAQNPGCLLVLELDANGQHRVIISLLDIPQFRYSRRVVIYVAALNQYGTRPIHFNIDS